MSELFTIRAVIPSSVAADINADVGDSLSAQLNIKIAGGGEYERYAGAYDVTPDFETQVLETDGKLMRDDVTVNPIPVSRTSNDYGTTVYIGGLLNG